MSSGALPSDTHEKQETPRITKEQFQQALHVIETYSRDRDQWNHAFETMPDAKRLVFHMQELIDHRRERRSEEQSQSRKRKRVEGRQEQIKRDAQSGLNVHAQRQRAEWLRLQDQIKTPKSAAKLFVNTTPVHSVMGKNCYICKHQKSPSHSFYSSMCVPCGDHNFQKRNARLPPQMGAGKVAIVTGGRIKIGFEVARRLLESGFTVIVTTRFVNDCWIRYRKEKACAAWEKEKRLHVLEMDLSSGASIDLFVTTVKTLTTHVDVLIQNAAQTDRKPPAFYKSLLALPDGKQLDVASASSSSSGTAATTLTATASSSGSAVTTLTTLSPWQARLPSLVSKIPSDFLSAKQEDEYFPPGELDADGIQVDRRPKITWNSSLAETSIFEMIETTAINQIAPIKLIQDLTPLMHNDTKTNNLSFIINVSAVEGLFYNFHKSSGFHIVNNMTKCAMNMATRTLGQFMMKDHHIVVNSVDTGWNSVMFPEQRAQHLRSPIDCEDGAARIVDPIFTTLMELASILSASQQKDCAVNRLQSLKPGFVLKDYQICPF